MLYFKQQRTSARKCKSRVYRVTQKVLLWHATAIVWRKDIIISFAYFYTNYWSFGSGLLFGPPCNWKRVQLRVGLWLERESIRRPICWQTQRMYRHVTCLYTHDVTLLKSTTRVKLSSFHWSKITPIEPPLCLPRPSADFLLFVATKHGSSQFWQI